MAASWASSSSQLILLDCPLAVEFRSENFTFPRGGSCICLVASLVKPDRLALDLSFFSFSRFDLANVFFL